MIDQNNWTKKKIPEPENSIKKIKWIQNPVVSIRCEKKTQMNTTNHQICMTIYNVLLCLNSVCIESSSEVFDKKK